MGYECGTLDFPEPPYPNTIQCPQSASEDGSAASMVEVGVWAIIAKVRVEAFCWGMGTAIGELPPYFMARAARLSGGEPGEDTEEFLELQEKLKNPEKMTRFERAKYGIQHPKPTVRPGRHHLWPLPCPLLDIFRRHPHWKGCD